jgi:hypothetical protein
MSDLLGNIGPVVFGAGVGWVTIRRPRQYDDLMRRAGATWDPRPRQDRSGCRCYGVGLSGYAAGAGAGAKASQGKTGDMPGFFCTLAGHRERRRVRSTHDGIAIHDAVI